MNRTLIVLALLTALSGCSPQKIYNNHAYIINNCDNTTTFKPRHASNFESKISDAQIQPGETLLIANYISYGESIFEQISSDYRLSVENINGTKIIDAPKFRTLLSQATKKTTDHRRSWTISTKDICPTKQMPNIISPKHFRIAPRASLNDRYQDESIILVQDIRSFLALSGTII